MLYVLRRISSTKHFYYLGFVEGYNNTSQHELRLRVVRIWLAIYFFDNIQTKFNLGFKVNPAVEFNGIFSNQIEIQFSFQNTILQLWSTLQCYLITDMNLEKIYRQLQSENTIRVWIEWKSNDKFNQFFGTSLTPHHGFFLIFVFITGRCLNDVQNIFLKRFGR